MNKKTGKKYYEKCGWIIFVIIGVLLLTGGIPHMFGNNTDPDLVKAISGQTIDELRNSDTLLFNLYDFYFRGGGLSDIGVAIFLIVISIFGFRTGQKWAWYSLWFVPLFFTGWLFLLLPLPEQAQSSMFTPLIVLIVLSLMGLLLPFRKFFPKNSTSE
jgi:hypothetical protein